jgi:hypothetical protein
MLGLALLGTSPAAAEPRRFDLGIRLGYARPLGAFDRATHAADTSHGGVGTALDATVRIGPPAEWNVSAGIFAGWAETIPRLCASASECLSSLGRDAELGVVVRVRGPQFGFLLPEAEMGQGWSWSSRSLADEDATSSHRWSGPVLLRGALVPSIRLGDRTRLGFVLGGSVARSTTLHVEAPGIDTHRTNEARLHSTFDIGLRFGIDFGDR